MLLAMSKGPEWNDRLVLQLGLLVAFLGVLVYGAAAYVAGDYRFPAPTQPDHLLFLQYGKAISQGHPYRYIPGDAPSTGNTSHLYPLVVSALHLLGARGDRLLTATFVLSAGFYLVILWLVFRVGRLLFPESPATYRLAFGLVLLSGQTQFTLLGQTDMGLFMVLALFTLDAALRNRFGTAAFGLLLCVFCRPEGAILSGLFLLAGLLTVALKQRGGRPFLFAGGTGCLGVIVVMGVNQWLTGTSGFHSLAHKGYFEGYTWLGWLSLGVHDAGVLVREILFGISAGGRELYMMPILAGLLFVVGVATRPWSWTRAASRVEAVALVGVLGGVALVSVSGWQGFVFDRHLAWIMPILFLYVAAGTVAIVGRFNNPRLFGGLIVLLLGYQAVGCAFFFSQFIQSGYRVMGRIAFAEEVDAFLPPEATIGGAGGAIGFAHFMPGRHITNVHGVSSPHVHNKVSIRSSLEILKHTPAYRFSHWMVRKEAREQEWLKPFLGTALFEQTDALDDPLAFGLLEADWRLMDPARAPLRPEVVDLTGDWKEVDRLDVGYPEDERRTGYTVENRVPGMRVDPLAMTGSVGTQQIAEVGRVVIGSERFRVRTRPGLPLRVVLRTATDTVANARLHSQIAGPNRFRLADPLRLVTIVNGEVQEPVDLDLGGEAMTEVAWDIPAALVVGEETDLTVAGDHASLAYWFYQPANEGE